MKILLHGGAGNIAQTVSDIKNAAVQRVAGRLSIGGMGALDAVEMAVSFLEEDEDLNAGRGSVVQMDGMIRMDAGICDDAGRYGAVMQIENVLNPVRVARRILDYGYHSILSGHGAQQFARENGFPSACPMTEKKMQEFLRIRQELPSFTYDALAQRYKGQVAQYLSTVGAVCIDAQGRLAAACSTGGTNYIYPGRVGDTPIFGAGVYCSRHVAVACTGEGDKFVRTLLARSVEDFYLQDRNLQHAVEKALQKTLETHKGRGGIIAIADNGDSAFAHTTPFMACTLKE